MRIMKNLLLTLVLLMFFGSCKKNQTDFKGQGSIALKVRYAIDGEGLQMGQLKYVNEAGNVYSVTRLQYYISHIALFDREYGWTLIDTFYLFDADKYPIQRVVIGNVPLRYYDSIKFYIGLPPSLNHHDSLPNTIEHQEMIWPEMMGGGFHFLKLEGKFKETDTSSTISGYAMHLGTNVALVTVSLPAQIDLTEQLLVEVSLEMNVNEWFRNPHTYNLAEKSYIMGDTLRMQIIARNGQDVFTVVSVN